MKKILILCFLAASCSHQKNVSQKEIETYCQDLNVLYQKINATTSNIINIKTTRTAKGGAYVRQEAVNCLNGICEIKDDPTHPMLKYEPKSPDSDKNGYVAYPNINLIQEEADRDRWSRVYETVIANSPVPENFFFKDKRAANCFKKYSALKEALDYSEYLGREL